MFEEKFLRSSTGLVQVESAGGLIVGDDAVLFILKKGKWDLPKGRIEEGHSCEETALREVAEETGIEEDMTRIVGPLCTTWHVTAAAGSPTLKKTFWFVMEYRGDSTRLVPQVEEGITDCRWIKPSDFSLYRPKMRTRINYVSNLWKKLFYKEKTSNSRTAGPPTDPPECLE